MSDMSYPCKADCTYHYKSELPKTLQPYFNYIFGSTSDDMKSFLRKYRNVIHKKLPVGYSLFGWYPNWYCASGIICTSKNHYIYFSIPDIRYCLEEWWTNILYRKMDFVGDFSSLSYPNHYTTLFDFIKNIKELWGD